MRRRPNPLYPGGLLSLRNENFRQPRLRFPPYTYFYSICRASYIALFTVWLMPRLWMPFSAWALTVAMSRCLMGRHYLSDVIAGLLVGLVTIGVITKVRGGEGRGIG